MRKLQLGLIITIALLFTACGGNQKQNTTAETDSTTTKADTVDKTTQKAIEEQQHANDDNKKVILFFGDSITAGLGLDDPATQSFPAIIKARIDSLKLPFKVINAGLSGETTASGKNRIDWLLKQKIDFMVLELGANDGLRGLPADQTSKNLQIIIDKVHAQYPDASIILTGMMVPPNMGAGYSAAFKAVFPALGLKNHLPMVPFLLQDVAGNKQLNQNDGIHPNARGARIVADNVWNILYPLMQ